MRNPGFRDRLGALVGEEAPYSWAARMGISKGAFTRMWREGVVPGPDILLKIKQGTEASLDWLVAGEGYPPDVVFKTQQKKQELQLAYLNGHVDDIERLEVEIRDLEQAYLEKHTDDESEVSELEDFVLVPRYDVQGSMGGGSIVHSEQIVDHLAFKTEWVHNQLRVSPSNLVLISAVGDSMEPTLSDGDLLLIDKSEAQIREDAIYVLVVGDGLMVKRVQRLMDGTVIIKSDNAAYQDQVLQRPEVESLQVLGRVVWSGHRM